MSRMSNKVDGVSFDMYRGRFTGTIDLEDEEAEATAIGETVVMVVVATVNDANAKLDKAGDMARIAVFKATDARILDDELKTLMVQRLGLTGGDTDQPVLIVPGERLVKDSVDSDGVILTGELKGFVGEQLSFDDIDIETLTPDRSEGPRTVPFNTMPSFLPSDSQVVGVVGNGDEDWRNIDG